MIKTSFAVLLAMAAQHAKAIELQLQGELHSMAEEVLESHIKLKSILKEKEEKGESITKCEAFALFAEADLVRTLKDLLSVDPSRTRMGLEVDNTALNSPATYTDPCYVAPFVKFAEIDLDDDGETIFRKGLLLWRNERGTLSL